MRQSYDHERDLPVDKAVEIRWIAVYMSCASILFLRYQLLWITWRTGEHGAVAGLVSDVDQPSPKSMRHWLLSGRSIERPDGGTRLPVQAERKRSLNADPELRALRLQHLIEQPFELTLGVRPQWLLDGGQCEYSGRNRWSAIAAMPPQLQTETMPSSNMR
ncbi:hypothetical protein [Roseateles noduli]|uniref:hypothetical protein n=1 Tax=Roseateles noduli TaxID=2052484 RepID=UPI003D657F31